MKIRIEEKSGFCYGVDRVVQMAESILDSGKTLYCLGQIVHNETEVERLKQKGLITISYEDLPGIRNCSLMLRAHGEPPTTYRMAKENNIEIIDGTCPVVRKIQNSIAHHAQTGNSLLVIFGKHNHPEVIGLLGQAPGNSAVVSTVSEVDDLPGSEIIQLFAQTTMDQDTFHEITEKIRLKQKNSGGKLIVHNTICRHVSHRKPGLVKFAGENDVIIFVGGKSSSNGKALFNICKEVNKNSYYIGNADELVSDWFRGVRNAGIAGATSTPYWQVEQVYNRIVEITGRLS